MKSRLSETKQFLPNHCVLNWTFKNQIFIISFFFTESHFSCLAALYLPLGHLQQSPAYFEIQEGSWNQLGWTIKVINVLFSVRISHGSNNLCPAKGCKTMLPVDLVCCPLSKYISVYLMIGCKTMKQVCNKLTVDLWLFTSKIYIYRYIFCM